MFGVAMLLTACQTGTTQPTQAPGTTPKTDVKSEDFYSVYTQEIGTLNYLSTNKSVDADAIASFCDPLILVDKFGGYEAGMALSWSQSEDGLTWTFNIRPNVKWLTWDGKEYGPNITAQDWVDAAEYILDPNFASYTVDFVLDFIAGANEYYDSRSPVEEGEEEKTPLDFSTVGVKAVDEYTLQYTTLDVCPFFPSLVTYSCFLPISKQFVEEIGGIDNFGTDKDKFLYYGEYLFKTWTLDQEWTFVKNEKYYLADRVHVNLRNYVQILEPKVALEMYKRGEISAAAISSDQLDGAMADPELAPYVFRTTPNSSSWYWYFNYGSPNTNLVAAAKNENFRQAIMAAFDRTTYLSVANKNDPNFLKRNTLNVWGLSVDENGKDYMTYGRLQEIEERDSYQPEKAMGYLNQAKEELGSSVTWPISILITVGASEAAINRAEILKQSLEENLEDNVVVDFLMYTNDTYYQVQEEAAFDFTQGGWIPDYADPSSYLEINQVNGYIGDRYKFGECEQWVVFDEMMKAAKAQTSSLSARFEAMAEAECYIIDHALVIPISASGGNYAINNIQNPYDSLDRIKYGLCNSMFKDRIYGTKPLTTEEREAQRLEYEAEAAAMASK